ncbi:NlpC/P60 family protein [Erysipelotrichaceae bacterium 3_1_53]|nr:NlpC/P60 family protein [Erysipelotrichaceae bacterium 3_1_53]
MNPAGSGSNSSAAGIAASMVGSPYVWGGSSPAGFDCSGLTSYAYAQAGISIPRTAGGQAGVGSPVSYGNMQPGDLIVWSGGAHVSIYVGGGQMVHATNPSTGVITSSVSYWSNNSGQSITAIRRP